VVVIDSLSVGVRSGVGRVVSGPRARKPQPADPTPRVCLLIGDLARGGAETQLVELALGLKGRRYSVEIVLLKERNDFAPELAKAGVGVTALHRTRWDVAVLWRLYRHLRNTRPDVLHSFLPVANLAGVVAGRAARVPRVLVSIRCSYEATLGPVWRRVARWSHRRADRVIVNSEAALREEIEAGFPPERLDYVPNGIRLARSPTPSRAALDLPAGPLVLSVGQLEAIKGHRDLIDAWATVRAAVPDAILLLVGAGSLRAELEESTRRQGVASSVLFLGFRKPRPFFAACALLVQPSVSEGMPNAVLEAMAARRPVVATRVGGIPEVVSEGETGVLVPPADPPALARAIVGLLADPKRRTVMGEAAWHRVRDRFQAERMVTLTEGAYRRSHRLAVPGFAQPVRQRAVAL
jgi:glycosyltransferase involved in cell wall biosynthesis